MTLSLHKTIALFKLKTMSISSNKTLFFGPIFSIFFTLMYRFILPVPPHMDGSEQVLMVIYLNLGVLMNTLMTGLMVAALPISEEKEKYTLRVLMTSSINWAEYFLGSLLPVFFITEIVNLILIPVCNVNVLSMPYYLLFTSLGALISILLGAGIGLACKDQTATSLIITPIMMFMLLPAMLGNMIDIDWMEKLSQITYTGAMTNMLTFAVSDETSGHMITDIIVLTVWLAIAIAVFGLLYKRNKTDHD